MKLDIGLPVDGVVHIAVTGAIRDDDVEVLAFALASIPTRHGIALDLRTTDVQERHRRALRAVLLSHQLRTPGSWCGPSLRSPAGCRRR